MDKDFILEQIREVSIKLGGQTPGKGVFQRESGIKESDWAGRYWVRWNDAVLEAGLPTNVMQVTHNKLFVVKKFISLIKELGKFPTNIELQMKSRTDADFPARGTFKNHLVVESQQLVQHLRSSGNTTNNLPSCLRTTAGRTKACRLQSYPPHLSFP